MGIDMGQTVAGGEAFAPAGGGQQMGDQPPLERFRLRCFRYCESGIYAKTLVILNVSVIIVILCDFLVTVVCL